MKIGYARVSTWEQNLDLQIDALKKEGCEKIIHDKVSGSTSSRPGLSKLKELLRKGDDLIVWRLDRLGRTLRHLIEWINELEKDGIGFKSIQESIDTTTAGGKLTFHLFGALAEFERNLVSERTKAGLEAARARGKLVGRPAKLSPDKRKLLVKLYKEDKHSISQLCNIFSISAPTVYKCLHSEEENK